MKYRKLPVEIDATVWDCSEEKLIIIQAWAGDKIVTVDDKGFLLIETLEGSMIGNVGDYIIRGIKGEVYPCKPDIFKETYELVAPKEH